jgi:electron transport complex protein RnfB
MLTLTEAAATFKSVAPSLAGDAPIPPGDENLVAVRLCDRLGGRPQILASFQAPAICRTAAALSDGPYACPQACLGLGDCARVCPYGALLRPSGAAVDSPPEIDASRCRACGQCLKACPRQLMTLKPRLAPSVVSCRGTARMKEMDRLCASGCLGCGLCRKACPIGAVSRRSRQAPPPVNYQACLTAFPNCGLACQSACPRRLPGPAGVPRPNSQPD